MEPLRLEPIYNRTIWAGQRLALIRGRVPAGEGTSWEVSVHPSAQSVVAEGAHAGLTLAALIDEDPAGMLGADVEDGDLLRLAFLDTGEALSVQVHPGERYAQAHEGDHGKTEAWYILAADEGACLVAGSDFTSADEVREALRDGLIEGHLHHIPVREGDCVVVPSGTLHALGAGILALEIGTNSNTTYRFYDYGRRDKDGNLRELHIEKSLDVVRLDQRGTCVSTPLDHQARVRRVVSLPEYSVDLIDVTDEFAIPPANTFRTLSCVHGQAALEAGAHHMELAYTESVFVPAVCGKLVVKGPCRLLLATPRPRSHMVLEEPPYRTDFTEQRTDQNLKHSTTKLKDVAHLYADARGIDPEAILYEVCADEGDPHQAGSLSYGLTTIHPVLVGGECPFTRGHWHNDESCDEIYQGESGEGLLMLMNHEGITWCERVSAGSSHRIAGTLAHRLINTGDTDLLVRAVWSPHAGHDYAAVANQPFGFRVFRREGEIEVRRREDCL